MATQENREAESRKKQSEWKKANGFKQIERWCRGCKHCAIGEEKKPPKYKYFIRCALATKETGEDFIIVENDYYCDRWEAPF